MATWTCELCTFVGNAAGTACCEVCAGPNPATPQPYDDGDDDDLRASDDSLSSEEDDGHLLASSSASDSGGTAAVEVAAAAPSAEAKARDVAVEAAEQAEEAEAVSRWCRAVTASFDALCTVAVLFHARAAPLFLRTIAPTVFRASGRPFDEVSGRSSFAAVAGAPLPWTACVYVAARLTGGAGSAAYPPGRRPQVTVRALVSVSPRQVSLRQEVDGAEFQIGRAEPRVVLRFGGQQHDGSDEYTPVNKRARFGGGGAAAIEPSRAGGFAGRSWRGAGLAGDSGGGGWGRGGGGGGGGRVEVATMVTLVEAAKKQFRECCQDYVRQRRALGRSLPRLHEASAAPAPSSSTVSGEGEAGGRQPSAHDGVAAQAGWREGQVVTARNFFEYIKTTDDYKEQLVHVEPIPARLGEWRPLPTRLASAVRDGLLRMGIPRLFSHQVREPPMPPTPPDERIALINKNCLRFPYDSTCWRSHYLHPPPPGCRVAASHHAVVRCEHGRSMVCVQAEGIESILDGCPALIATTATSSGKSMLYHLHDIKRSQTDLWPDCELPMVVAMPARILMSQSRYTVPIAESYLGWLHRRRRVVPGVVGAVDTPAPRALLVFPTKVRLAAVQSAGRALLSPQGRRPQRAAGQTHSRARALGRHVYGCGGRSWD
jgi:hypothetical protein